MKNCFRTFSATDFPIFSAKGNNQKGKLFLQDEALSQKCKMSQDAMDKIACRLFRIPPRSPDINLIENIFHLVGVCLGKDAIKKKIKKERPMKTSVFVLLTHFITFHQILYTKQLHQCQNK